MNASRPRQGQYLAILLLLCSLTLFNSVLSLRIGSTPLSWGDLYAAFTEDGSSTSRMILVELRLPRLIAAFAVGAGLATAGAAYQALFRNILADPYIIGASSGATVGLTLTIALSGVAGASLLSIGGPATGAFLGSFFTVAFVYFVAVLGVWPSSTMLLFGVIISMMLSSVVWLILALADEQLSRVVAWLMGGFGSVRWEQVYRIVPVNAAGLMLLWCLSRPLDALALGSDDARSLGLSVRGLAFLVLLSASVMISASVALAGSIGFVGLIAPQAARWLVGSAHHQVIPAAALIGGLLLQAADTTARSIIPPLELPVGVVTAFLGGPLFLLLLRSQAERGTHSC